MLLHRMQRMAWHWSKPVAKPMGRELTEEGELDMGSKSFVLELRVNFNDDHRVMKETLLRELAANTANLLLAKAMLLQDRSSPRVSLYESSSLDASLEVDLEKYSHDDTVCFACGHSSEG